MGGITLPSASAAVISGAGRIVVYAQSAAGAAAQSKRNSSIAGAVSGLDVQFRPPQWSQPALTMITVPAAYAGAIAVAGGGSSASVSSLTNTGQKAADGTPLYSMNVNGTNPMQSQPNAAPQMLVFDAVMRASHSQQARPTMHPIQDNANFTDHIVLDPAHLSLDILMTDVLPAYASGQWVGNSSKSIACFNTLCALRDARVPLQVTTRLKTYQNMFILNVLPDDTVRTRYGLRATVEFQQINLFSVATSVTSARSQTTDYTSIGQTGTSAVPTGVTAQNSDAGHTSTAAIQQQTGTMIGSGNWSDNSFNQTLSYLRSIGKVS